MSDLILRGTVIAGGRRIDDGIVAVTGDRIGWVGPTADWTEAGHAASVRPAAASRARGRPLPRRGRPRLPGGGRGRCTGSGGPPPRPRHDDPAREPGLRAAGGARPAGRRAGPARRRRPAGRPAPGGPVPRRRPVRCAGPRRHPAGRPRGAARGARRGTRRGRHDDPGPGDRALRRPARGARRARRRPEPRATPTPPPRRPPRRSGRRAPSPGSGCPPPTCSTRCRRCTTARPVPWPRAWPPRRAGRWWSNWSPTACTWPTTRSPPCSTSSDPAGSRW